jgi:arginine deiminase
MTVTAPLYVNPARTGPLADPLGTCSVESEVAALRRVLLHRPGVELERIVPDNCDSMLFDDIPWLPAAQREHDAFADILRRHGVEVVHLDALLRTAVLDPVSRRRAIVGCLDPSRIGQGLRDRVYEHLAGLSPHALVDVLLQGLCVGELGDAAAPTLVHCSGRARRFVVEPLPNQMFVRDGLTVVGTAVSVNRFAEPARVREADNLRSLLPADPARLVWDRGFAPAPVEGGDIAVVGGGCVLIGVGARTTPAGAEFLAAQLLERGLARTVLAVCLPESRQTMHLDTVLTMVDRDAFLGCPAYLEQCRVFRLGRGRRGEIRARAADSLPIELARALGVPAVRIIPTGGDGFAQYREQWSDAANVLALRPGLVIAYDRNAHANEALSRAGVEVVTIPSSELSRGRGGPHCLSCPLLREDL